MLKILKKYFNIFLIKVFLKHFISRFLSQYAKGPFVYAAAAAF